MESDIHFLKRIIHGKQIDLYRKLHHHSGGRLSHPRCDYCHLVCTTLEFINRVEDVINH